MIPNFMVKNEIFLLVYFRCFYRDSSSSIIIPKYLYSDTTGIYRTSFTVFSPFYFILIRPLFFLLVFILFCSLHSSILPFFYSSIHLFFHSSIHLFFHSSILPFFHSSILQFIHSSILPFFQYRYQLLLDRQRRIGTEFELFYRGCA